MSGQKSGAAMKTLPLSGVEELISLLDQAVSRTEVREVTAEVKRVLSHLIQERGLRLPSGFYRPLPGAYARRLLHRDPELRYTVVVMTWGPGQSTPLHDHAGHWCVEGVLQGQLEITHYDLVERADSRLRFEPVKTVVAGVGKAGCLIPPFEYHTMANLQPEAASVTIHVYGGELEECMTFTAVGGGWYQQRIRQLGYVD